MKKEILSELKIESGFLPCGHSDKNLVPALRARLGFLCHICEEKETLAKLEKDFDFLYQQRLTEFGIHEIDEIFDISDFDITEEEINFPSHAN